MIKTFLLILFFTLFSCVNSKHISLDKSEIKKLKNEEIATLENQKIVKDKTPIIENTNDSTPAFSGKYLIKTYFNPTGFRTDSIALTGKNDELYEIEFLKMESYRQDGKEFALAFFTVYQLILFQNELIQDSSTAAIGSSKFSIIKFKKEDNKWTYINKWDDLETGINIRGETYIPHIIQKNGLTFLELPDIVFYASGSKDKLTTLFNTKNFKKSLEIYTSSYNGIDDIDEFITSMNNDIYDKYGSFKKDYFEDLSLYLWNASDYKLEYKTTGNELFINVFRTDGLYNEKKKKFVKEIAKETYKYDKETLNFILIKSK